MRMSEHCLFSIITAHSYDKNLSGQGKCVKRKNVNDNQKTVKITIIPEIESAPGRDVYGNLAFTNGL